MGHLRGQPPTGSRWTMTWTPPALQDEEEPSKGAKRLEGEAEGRQVLRALADAHLGSGLGAVMEEGQDGTRCLAFQANPCHA